MGKRPDMRKRMGRGADIFFEDTSALDTSKDNMKDTDKDSVKDTNDDNTQTVKKDTTQYTNKHTEHNINNDTAQCTNKYTIEMPDTSELYNERLVANVTRSQKKYVEQTAKKHKMNNSEFVRFMIDFFAENFELK